MRLELARSSEVLCGRGRRLALWLRPKRVAQFAPFPGAQTVKRQAKRDSNEPRERQAGRTRQGAPRTRASCQPGLPRAPAHPPSHARPQSGRCPVRPQGDRPCHLVGPEPAPAFVILREIRMPVLSTTNQTPRAENWFSAERPFPVL